MKRHCVLIHRDKKPVSKRKRPTRVAFKRRVVRRRAAASPRAEADESSGGKSSKESESESSKESESESESEELEEEDELEEELQTVEMATLVNEGDNEESVENNEDEKYEHCDIIGTITLTGGEQEPPEFFIR